jgi:hypothetical protein
VLLQVVLLQACAPWFDTRAALLEGGHEHRALDRPAISDLTPPVEE